MKTWEMEIVHKANRDEYKTLDSKKFRLHINGKIILIYSIAMECNDIIVTFSSYHRFKLRALI